MTVPFVASAVPAPPAADDPAVEQDVHWARLMGLAQAGDKTAYRRLLIELAPYLRNFASRHHRDHRDVEDSVQDILMTLHAIRHTYDPTRPFKPWLIAVARRRVIDRLRAQRRTQLRETELLDAHETFSAPETNLHEAKSEARALAQALEHLPPAQRQAVKLLKIEEKSLKEAEAETGVSVASLKVSTHRALKNLRRILERKSELP